MKRDAVGRGRDKVWLASIRLLIKLLILMLQRLQTLVTTLMLQASETPTRWSELLPLKFIGETVGNLVFSITRHWGHGNSFQTHIIYCSD
jgi:hypothetical protein